MPSASGHERQSSPEQRAQAWIDDVRARARGRGLLELRVGGASIDGIDVLRAELSRSAVSALAVHAQPPSVATASARARAWAYRARGELRALSRRPSTELALPARHALVLPRLNSADVLPIAAELASRHGVATALLRTAEDVRAGPLRGAIQVEDQSGLRGRTAALAAARYLRALAPILEDAARSSTLGDGEGAALAGAVRSTLGRSLASAIRVGAGVDRILRAGRTAVVLVGNPTTHEGRVAALVARHHGVPSVTVEHGALFARDPVWAECPVDLICAWGEPSREILLGYGIPASRIAAVGSAKLDERLRQLDGAHERRTILVATSGAGHSVQLDEHVRFIAALAEAARARPELDWAVKLHRKDDPALYRALPPHVRLMLPDRASFGVDIFEQLKSAAVLVTVQSASAIDAMIAGVPVIAVDVDRRGRRGRTAFLAHAREAHDGATLLAEIDGVLRREPHPTDESAPEFVALNFANRGRAAIAAADAIGALLERS